MFTNRVTIENTGHWLIDSLGNGAAYELSYVEDADDHTVENYPTVFLQGDDATLFRADYDKAWQSHSDNWEKVIAHAPGSTRREWGVYLDDLCSPYFSE